MTTKEHAKNFKDWEILAFLNNKKTQFRETIKSCADQDIYNVYQFTPDHPYPYNFRRKDGLWSSFKTMIELTSEYCPYNIGDYIWGQEAFCSIKMNPTSTPLYFYKVGYKSISGESLGWTHPICMPRKASRILQQITDIRIEQLQDISEDDCLAEGIEYQGNAYDTIAAFAESREDWELNPYTWVYKVQEIKND